MWSNELELKFIEHFHSEPILWDSKHRNYKDKTLNYDAWNRIWELMDMPVPVPVPVNSSPICREGSARPLGVSLRPFTTSLFSMIYNNSFIMVYVVKFYLPILSVKLNKDLWNIPLKPLWDFTDMKHSVKFNEVKRFNNDQA
ncbi:hypothetical protein FQA39_LY14657 [Lamprigera yunnana]|nr:hypothetical protein FQA39_LY14657 [Lamprigera yunnana]